MAFNVVFACSANKGFWSQLLGVGDFYYEVRRARVEPDVRRCLANA